MRTTVSSTILSIAVLSAWMGWVAQPAQAGSPGECQVSCNADNGCTEQASCEAPAPSRNLLGFLDTAPVGSMRKQRTSRDFTELDFHRLIGATTQAH